MKQLYALAMILSCIVACKADQYIIQGNFSECNNFPSIIIGSSFVPSYMQAIRGQSHSHTNRGLSPGCTYVDITYLANDPNAWYRRLDEFGISMLCPYNYEHTPYASGPCICMVERAQKMAEEQRQRERQRAEERARQEMQCQAQLRAEQEAQERLQRELAEKARCEAEQKKQEVEQQQLEQCFEQHDKELQHIYKYYNARVNDENIIKSKTYKRYSKRIDAFKAIQRDGHNWQRKQYALNHASQELLHETGISHNNYTSFFGNQLQHLLHEETIAILSDFWLENKTMLNAENKQCAKALAHCADMAYAYNTTGAIVQGFNIIDFCHTLFEGLTIIKNGVAQGIAHAINPTSLAHAATITVGSIILGTNIMASGLGMLIVGSGIVAYQQAGGWHGIKQITEHRWNHDKVGLINDSIAFAIEYIVVGKLFNACNKISSLWIEEALRAFEQVPSELRAMLTLPGKKMHEYVAQFAELAHSYGTKTINNIVHFAAHDPEFLPSHAMEPLTTTIEEFAERLQTKRDIFKIVKDTDERCRLVRPACDIKAHLEWAPKKYEEIRLWKDDITKIAHNTKLPEFKIKRIKNHLFYNNHIFLRSGRFNRFDCDAEIASAWDRLYHGDFIKSDLQLLEHEYFESKFESLFKTDYDAAHNAAKNCGYSWDHPTFKE